MKRSFQTWLFICFIFAIVFGSLNAIAQLSVKGIPESFNLSLKNAHNIPVFQLDSVQINKLLQEDRKYKIDNRYGIIQQCNINIKDLAVKTEITGKGTIWQYKIESKNAFSLGLFFKTFNLPEGASVFIYDSSKSHLRGAFTNQNNNSDHQLSIAEFQGNNLTIEYFEPLQVDFSGQLIIGSVSQAYINFESAAVSRIGINCPQGTDWQTEKTCVCLMTFNDTQYSYYCTGSLVNNTKEDGTPYFLTANHCINTSVEARTLVTYFNFENSSCTSSDAALNQSLSGATLKSANSYSDFSLLLLKEYPAPEYNPFFAGWDATGNIPNSGVCIHHPNGTYKCIAIDSDPLVSYENALQWTDETGKVISTSLGGTHWQVQFNQGNVESGSSGSPIFNESHRVVGQLHGGSDTESYYGKFSMSWNHSSVSTQQLAYWLDPTSSGKKILDGLGVGPPKANFSAELQEVCINTPVLFTDQSKNNPTEWLWTIKPSSYSYTNRTDSTSQNPRIMFLQDGAYSITLSESNKNGSDKIIKENYIVTVNQLDVEFSKTTRDSVVCGCNLNSFPLVARGALTYVFNVSEKTLIDTKTSADTIFLSLNQSAAGGKSFDTWVKVTGTHGACTGSDSILFHVIVQPNDNIANAPNLSLGRNTGYSNQCATVETKEPYPASSGCLIKDNWCPDLTGTGSVLNNSIWFTFNAPTNGLLNINTSGFDDQIAIYDATTSALLISGNKSNYSLIAANDDRSSSDNTSQIENLSLDPGKKYWLQVDGNNGAFGNLVIDLISNSIEVYPNPSTGIFNLTISNPVAGLATVFVYDLQGRRLIHEQHEVSLTSNKFKLDLSGYAKGMYLLNVQMNGSNLSKKLIRQ